MIETTNVIKKENIQPLLLKILVAFNNFCLNNNINYFLAAGTLLGAHLHKGFIPWDDDIDLYIKEAEADKLIKIANNNPYIDDECRYKILMPGENPNTYPFFKIIDTKTIVYETKRSKDFEIGLWIDVFVLKYWPNNYIKSKLLLKKKDFYKLILNYLTGYQPETRREIFFKRIILLIMKVFNKDYQYFTNKIYKLGFSKETNYIGNIAWGCDITNRYKKEWFRSSTKIEFEKMMLPAPIDYEKLLKCRYGNYIKYPPESERKFHKFEVFYKIN